MDEKRILEKRLSKRTDERALLELSFMGKEFISWKAKKDQDPSPVVKFYSSNHLNKRWKDGQNRNSLTLFLSDELELEKSKEK